jgi:hypothetical protein
MCIDGNVEVELVCEPVVRLRPHPAEWTGADGDRHAVDASGAGQQFRLQSDFALGIEGDRVRARHVPSAGRPGVLRASPGRELAAPQTCDEARPEAEVDHAFLAQLVEHGANPGTMSCATRSSAPP